MPHARGPSVDASTFAIPDDGTESVSGSSSDSSYAGSAREPEMEFSAVDYLHDQFMTAFDPALLDRAIVAQAQTSGILNAKSKEVKMLLVEANQRLSGLKGIFSEGIASAKQTERDLEWAARRSGILEKNSKDKFPIEYETVKNR